MRQTGIILFLILGLQTQAVAWFADIAAEAGYSNSYNSRNHYLTIGRENTGAPEITGLNLFSFTRYFSDETNLTDYGASIDTTLYNKDSWKFNLTWVGYFSHHFSETWAYRLSAIRAISEKANLALTYERRNYSDSLKNSDKVLLGSEIYTDYFYLAPSMGYASTKYGDSGEVGSLKIGKEWKYLYASYTYTAGKDLADINVIDPFTSHAAELKYVPWSTGFYYSRFEGQVRQESIWGIHISGDFK